MTLKGQEIEIIGLVFASWGPIRSKGEDDLIGRDWTMLSRRGFLEGVSGWLAAWGLVRGKEGTPVQRRECPEESVQDLIWQIRILEREEGNQTHIEAIQDQIRVRLLLAGMACTYVNYVNDRTRHICALETKTGSLWSLPYRESSLPWAIREWKRIGLAGLEDRINTIPRACDI